MSFEVEFFADIQIYEQLFSTINMHEIEKF